MSHRKEPWHVGGDGTIIYDEAGWGIANTAVFHGHHDGPHEAKETAIRITVCVNACRGISNADLEMDNVAFIRTFNERTEYKQRCEQLEKQRDALAKLCEFNERTMAELLKQRDDLLAALEMVIELPNYSAAPSHISRDEYNRRMRLADTAIASVKGKAE